MATLRLKPTDDVVAAQVAFERSFRSWLDDMEETFIVVEPCDAHLDVHSQRFFELFLRAGSDFEALCREILRLSGGGLPAKPTLATYRQLSAQMNLESVAVEFLFWRPGSLHLRPFEGWPSKSQNLVWFERLNDVKHDRLRNASLATMGNAMLAGSGVFALLAYGFGVGLLGAGGSTTGTPTRTTFNLGHYPIRISRDDGY